jgi:A/G-specific adenine glycosylase
MLQQTRVGAVIGRYEQFLEQFPSVEALASAPPASVLAAWSGLGYYRRARNLHAAAKLLVGSRKGKFPQTSDQWQELPGIGRYTAAAIASIAFDEPRAALDGNVVRVLVRLLGERRPPRALWQAAQQLLDPARPGDFNQAMMELGATICLPSSPRCATCPIESFCCSHGAAEPARPKLRPYRREIVYGLARKQHAVLLVRRDPGLSQMPGMWELPEICAWHGAERPLLSLRHAITVTNFTVHVVETRAPARGTWVSISRLANLPLTGLTKKILQRAGIID